ncbi:dynamin [Anaeramoeba ignava]|uniref:dynamin GTPase n=1 Tax=Anaeramoeba ignava TaxID=1746090 RepID=A0A9Q0RIY7_ANAIG|nr:dynamin [Anaeramoeba ignava]
MVLNYIKRPNCIILAVTPANSDLANSDSLKLAKSVDPKRERTIGVLTKLDLMDEGTDALDILNGDLLGMKFIGVVNRGQKDIDQKKKVKEALSSEETFFQTHPKYAHIADKMGSGYLATILNNKLIQHIQNSLPEISKSVDENLSKTESELEKIGETEGEIQRKQIAFRSLSGFAQEFKNLIDGTSSDVDGSVVSKFSERLLGGAKIKYHYTTALHDNIEDLRLEDDLDEETISKYIQNSEGAISRMGIPEKAFHWAIRVGLLRLFEPCKKCIMDVEKELIGIITDTTNKIQYFENFPMLRTRILEISIALIKRLTKPTLELIEQVIRMELAYINFENPTLHIRRFTEDKKSDILEGWLEKRRSKTKKWQRRWFVLKAKTLFYYSGPKEPTALGVVPLEGCIIETVDDIEKIKKELEEKKDDPEVSKKLIDFPEGPTDQPKRRKSIFSKSKNYPIPEQNLKTYFRIRHPINTVDGGEFMELLAENEVALKTWCSSLKRNAQGIFHEKNQANRDIWLVREVVISYFRTVKISIFDSVPKTVMYSLVNPLKSILEGELMARIYDEELMDELLNEDPAIKDRRKIEKNSYIIKTSKKKLLKSSNS